MNRLTNAITTIMLSLLVSACGNSSSPSRTPAPPPPPSDESPSGIWSGQITTPEIDDGFTSFEFADADGFEVGIAPFTVDFQGGAAASRGDPALYTDGTFSWALEAGIDGVITFDTPVSTLSLFQRAVTLGDVALISVYDTAGVLITAAIPIDSFVELLVERDPDAGDSLIGSVEVVVASGEVVVDSFNWGFPSVAAVNDANCVVTPSEEFACVWSDPATGAITGGANGTLSVSVTDVTGAGWAYAATSEFLANSLKIAPVTISAGAADEAATLDLTIDGTGVPMTLTSAYATTYERGADLATVAASYLTFDIFGDLSTFDVDATGAISGTSGAGCLLSGQLDVLDATVNVYDVSITVTDASGLCGVAAGAYVGFGVTQDENATDDAFVFGAFIDGSDIFSGVAIQ